MQRICDIVLVGFALLVLSPLFIPIIILLSLTGEREVFYFQQRIGKGGKPFKLFKFATMLKNSPNLGTGTITLKNDARILPMGKFLRKTKINELPQLINIITGDMSIVGPRPQTKRCFDAFPKCSQDAIIQVRPGLSGIGSIVFRDEEDALNNQSDPVGYYDNVIAPYKGALEEWYVQRQGITTYFLVIFITVWVLVVPNSKLVWKAFRDLPLEPDVLHDRTSVANTPKQTQSDSGPSRRPIRILFINQSFWPDVVATAQQEHDLVRSLIQEGDSVTVLASKSLYGQARATLPSHEIVDGVEIHRVSSNLFKKRGLTTRSIDYLRFNAGALIRALRLPKHDVVVCLTTPPFVALIGLTLQILKGSKFVFWTMDLYPDLPVKAGIVRKESITHKILRKIDLLCLRRADRVVALGRCMQERLVAKGVDPNKISLIRSWADPNEIPAVPIR